VTKRTKRKLMEIMGLAHQEEEKTKKKDREEEKTKKKEREEEMKENKSKEEAKLPPLHLKIPLL
jgi:hypothetical protein